jgi:hypothetical protein
MNGNVMGTGTSIIIINGSWKNNPTKMEMNEDEGMGWNG